MRFRFVVPAACLLFAVACSDNSTTLVQPAATGSLVVQIYYDDQGIPDKRVELVEPKLERTTNASGVVTFVVPAGDYTLRAYEINRGGPVMQHIDMDVTITAGGKAQVRVFDCLPCD
jgi:hypothetical protein